MSFDDKFAPIRTFVYESVSNFFKAVASQYFQYPENPGMPTIYEMPDKFYARAEFLDRLPLHKTAWPPMPKPETWVEMIFGPIPKVDAVPRYVYESKEEGFYNFYIENYKNIYFLPDVISEFIQVKLNVCLDISVLETIREVLFVGFVVYTQIVVLRIAISWLIYINPYTVPWSYISVSVDWTEDVLQGIVPAILGVNITGSIFLGILGVLGDALNHIVFTMPFLPSEGEEIKLLINQEVKDVLVYHYLPVSWYRYSIPNEIRNYWYHERPDILEYMQKSYKDLNIPLLPDNVIQELNNQKNTLSNLYSIEDFIPSETISTELMNYFHNFINKPIM